MKTKGLAFIMLVLTGMGSFAQESEKRFGIEINSGVSFATKKMDDANLKPGFGYEGTLHYRFLHELGIYGGWGWNRFASDNSFAGSNVCFEETGYVFGLSLKDQIGISNFSYYVRAGALYNHIETENAEGDIINDTNHGFGYQLACGANINLGKNWSLSPGIKFNSLSRETEFEGTSKQLDYQYISIRVGISKTF